MLYDETCRYCTHGLDIDQLMIPVRNLQVSTLYLFKEQTYPGRCLLAYCEHKKEFSELTEAEAQAFSLDLRRACSAVKAFAKPDKLNLGVMGDKQPHLHVHIVPKHKDGPEWGKTFVMNPKAVYLTDQEYEAAIQEINRYLD
jgi:diadenosine tetraphosphate (Ap4A) HIT family hydrolase